MIKYTTALAAILMCTGCAATKPARTSLSIEDGFQEYSAYIGEYYRSAPSVDVAIGLLRSYDSARQLIAEGHLPPMHIDVIRVQTYARLARCYRAANDNRMANQYEPQALYILGNSEVEFPAELQAITNSASLRRFFEEIDGTPAWEKGGNRQPSIAH